jgi:arabinose-5-phosphate isomerase
MSSPDPVLSPVDQRIVARGVRVVSAERAALARAESKLGAEFARAVALVLASNGRVLVTGVGKSGHVGAKIASTLTSTGTAATFLHAVDGLHGDLGLVSEDDVAILISKSGESAELVALLDHLKRFGVKVIAITGVPDSTIARHSDVVLDAAVDEEACPHDLAPTASTTVALALGDALAVALLEERGFSAADFARLHPGGALGRRLLTKVSDVMERDALPLLNPSALIREAMVLLAERRGIVVVTDETCHVLGVVTTGDFTRLMERSTDPLGTPVRSVMTTSPRLAHATELGSTVVHRMQQHSIVAMPVLDDAERVVGVVHLHDLMRAGCG